MASCAAFVAPQSRFIASAARVEGAAPPGKPGRGWGESVLQKAHKIRARRVRAACWARRCWRCGRIRPRRSQPSPEIARAHLKLASLSTASAATSTTGARRAASAAGHQAVDGRDGCRRGRERPDHLPPGLWRDAGGFGRSGHARHGVSLGILSKGVAATMVAKLAEQGKVDLDAPVADYAPDLKLPAGNEYATVSDLLSHRLGLYRDAYDNKLEEGQDPSFLRTQLAPAERGLRAGTCWDYQNVAYDASSEMVARVTGALRAGGQAHLFDPIGMSSGSVRWRAWRRTRSWARPHSAGRRPWPMVDTYYKVPGAAGINSNIKDMALWMEAQMGEMPDVLDGQLLDTDPRALRHHARASAGGCASSSSGSAPPGTAWLAELRLCRAPDRRPSRRDQRLSLVHPVRPAEEKRRGRLVEQRHVAAGRARVRGDGHGLPPALPRLDGAGQQSGSIDRRRGASSDSGGGDRS